MIKNNENNLGGQILITQQMIDHKKKLLKIKPVINNNKKPFSFSHKTNLNTGKHKLKKEEDMKEVQVSFKKVLNMKKGYIDNKKPNTINYNHVKNKHNNKANKFINSEHKRNLMSMKNRINNVKNIQNRKKNPYDPVIYPVFCFRDDEKKEEVKIDFFVNKVKNKKIPKTQNINFKKEKAIKKVQKFDEEENLNNHESLILKEKDNDKSKDSNIVNKLSILKYEIPTGNINTENCFKKLEEELIELIIKYRIYKDEELHYLFNEFYNKNKHLEYLELEKIEDSIMLELDN